MGVDDARDKANANALEGATTLQNSTEGDRGPERSDAPVTGVQKAPSTRPQPPTPPECYSEGEDEDDTFHDAETTSYDQGEPTNLAGPSHEEETRDKEESACKPASSVALDPDITGAVVKNTNPKDAQSDEKHEPVTHPIDTSKPGKDQDEASPKASKELATSPIHKRNPRNSGPAVSEWSHQRLAPRDSDSGDDEEEADWQAMPALGEYDIYDDDGRLVAKAGRIDGDDAAYSGLGGAGKGYTRVQLDEDAQSATSMDEDTKYLFTEGTRPNAIDVEEEDQRDAMSQLQTTKDLLTEGQRIAYVGVTRLAIYGMLRSLELVARNKTTRKDLSKALESMEKWGQQMMVRLYGHMEIDSAEQVMIEQLAEHGVQPVDLVPPLMQNTKSENPLGNEASLKEINDSATDEASALPGTAPASGFVTEDKISPKMMVTEQEDVPEVKATDEIPQTDQIDLDLRWTVLCDLFLLLISDSVYDARSRYLLEQVGAVMEISWVQICRFEKRVMDALEMQEDAARENWNELDHMENRRKMGLKRKYMVMGLATVGGGLVIGLSAGLLAPVIGAGLAAGFTTIGVTGTAGFLGGVGGAALITSAATAAGGTIAVRASNRRTGHVKTFEYRPLHNNKRLNLILTVSGWMNGKVDDVRLPYSTVDPIMGDIYSLLWEPEMLQSMGDTINILATEALTQTVQQVLGSTILVALMASLQLPIVLTKLSYLIDNPWSVSLDRANSAGLILADSLMDRHLGQRPVTLIGFSLGSRLIFSCLRELANRGAYGLVQNVYLFGSPIVAKKDEYLRARSVVSGRFVNGFASNDWILGYLFRATSGGIMRIAGLAPVEDVPGLENIDVTSLVIGHMAYRSAMPKLMREVGWEVESDEFTEIEDPDPENHEKRQRELIQEIDDARKKAEAKPEKKRFGLFKRGRLAEKRGWETYETNKSSSKTGSGGGLASPGLEGNVLFDIDAIRRELESEMIEVRELDSTLPPMQISTLENGEKRVEPFPTVPDLQSDEHTKLKLPLRPDEINDDLQRPISTVFQTPKAPAPEHVADFEFEAPRELASTLPPLRLTPSQPQGSFHSSLSGPELKSNAILPANSSRTGKPAADGLRSPVEALNLEHNAWADGEEDEITMTFGP